jgi:hypothetical protein
VNARRVFRAIQRALGIAGLSISRAELDFEARLEDPRLLQRIFDELGKTAEGWFSAQTIVRPVAPFDTAAIVGDLYRAYLTSEFRVAFGGSRFNNLAWLCLIARALQPRIIVDSGTFRGASAWALKFGWPQARLYSFDIDMTRLRTRVPDVEYIEADWTSFDFSGEDLHNAFCYFDDHVDQARRLIEAGERGFPIAIFDDDFPITSFAAMACQGAALPKIEFVLDEELRKFREVTWSEADVRYTWPVDGAHLDRARALITATERLPNTSLVTGIHQTPYRIAALRIDHQAHNL